LEGPYTDHLVQLPAHFGADRKLKRVVKGIVQMILNTDRLGALITSQGSLFPCLTTLWVKEGFIMSSLSLLQHSSEPFPHVLSLAPREKSSAPPSASPPQEAVESHEAAPQPPFLQTRQTQSPQPLLIRHFFQPCTSFVALLRTHSNTLASSLNGGAQSCRQHSG